MPALQNVDPRIAEIERLLESKSITEERLIEARKLFREFLIAKRPNLETSATLGDVVAQISEDRRPFPDEAAYLVRYLSVQGLFPDNNSINNLYRHLVEISERMLAALCNFYKVQEKKQTYEKIDILINVHSHICAILTPVRTIPGELAAMQHAKQLVLSILHHGAVRVYCAPFGVAASKAQIETLFSLFARLNVESGTLSIDVREAQEVLTTFRRKIRRAWTGLRIAWWGRNCKVVRIDG